MPRKLRDQGSVLCQNLAACGREIHLIGLLDPKNWNWANSVRQFVASMTIEVVGMTASYGPRSFLPQLFVKIYIYIYIGRNSVMCLFGGNSWFEKLNSRLFQDISMWVPVVQQFRTGFRRNSIPKLDKSTNPYRNDTYLVKIDFPNCEMLQIRHMAEFL